MHINDIKEQLQYISNRTEEIFMNLAEKFPALLNKRESSSMDSLLTLFSDLEKNNTEVTYQESNFFASYDKKYTPLFEGLNTKIEDLAKVNADVKKIKDNSEEMELIALNAMVISIKSGEKGRAFSSITESLKQLSTDMNIYSNKLLEEEQKLLAFIKSLKKIFNELLDSQKSLSASGSSSAADVSSLIVNASFPLTEIRKVIESVYSPIQSAMEGLQLQDIIRQAMDHILLCLQECTPIDTTTTVDESALDAVTFNIMLLKLSRSVLLDINENIQKSIDIFKSNWSKVNDILHTVEPKRASYVSKFLDKSSKSPDNIYDNMSKITDHFSTILTQFGVYQANQKTLERNCNEITDKAHQMYAVFEVLKPIIDRLHHVRILQQIEVAKNPAIIAVKDSVTDMDNLITSANDSLEEMQEMLIKFIDEIKMLLTQFTEAIKSDNIDMNQLRISKNSFFNEFRNVQDSLSTILTTFTVFPLGFEQQCITVDNKLSELEDIHSSLSNIANEMENECNQLNAKKSAFLSRMGISSWELKDDRLKKLVEHFTITAHKEEAGQIGNFGVENGAPSGEITFF